MRADIVLDASVAAKFYFFETGSEKARTIITSGLVIATPELFFIEMASIAAKRVRMGLSTRQDGQNVLASLGDLLDEVAPLVGLTEQAFRLAHDHGFSAYDAAYLALAERLAAPVVTADERLVTRARAVSLGNLVQPL